MMAWTHRDSFTYHDIYRPRESEHGDITTADSIDRDVVQGMVF